MSFPVLGTNFKANLETTSRVLYYDCIVDVLEFEESRSYRTHIWCFEAAEDYYLVIEELTVKF